MASLHACWLRLVLLLIYLIPEVLVYAVTEDFLSATVAGFPKVLAMWLAPLSPLISVCAQQLPRLSELFTCASRLHQSVSQPLLWLQFPGTF